VVPGEGYDAGIVLDLTTPEQRVCTLHLTAAFRGVVPTPGDAVADPEGALALLTHGVAEYSVVAGLVAAAAAGASAVLAFMSQHNKHQWGATAK
jgi:hypothetical protein